MKNTNTRRGEQRSPVEKINNAKVNSLRANVVCPYKQKEVVAQLSKRTADSLYYFHQGTNYKSYDFLGCHFLHNYDDPKCRDVKCEYGKAVFRVWAPRARAVSLVGDFNNWDDKAHRMKRISDGGVWEVEVDYVAQYQKYKFQITTGNGRKLMKSDPYATFNETNGGTASMVFDINGYKWNDSEYMAKRAKKNHYESPMNIYEVNLASWKRKPDGSHYTYRMLADELVDYCVDMGYTHVELMPINEYPFEGSWGYQVTGYFSVTSRFGSPHDFMYFVDKAHQKGLGVIIDWVPAHFPKDANGLVEFDGEPLYEHPQPDRMEHKSWGTRIFDYGRCEVQSFLTSSAMMLLDYFHVDGLRVDAVASMLYLDYDRQDGEWTPNQHGENKNLEAIAFLQKLNIAVFGHFPDTLMIAEESTAWPMVTRPVSMGGLGFNFKWNMGWMNDVLEYVCVDPWFRCDHHNKLTFSMMYAFTENFMLPISHDEVVYGKGSLINKMFGNYDQKFDGLRTFLTYMYTHPGKKLLFMGSELGQFDEWSHNRGVQFNLLFYDKHLKTQEFVRALNHLYKDMPELHETDFDWSGFRWISVADKESNVLAYARKSKSGEEVICVFNFSLAERKGYKIKVAPGLYEEIFTTAKEKFGGWESTNIRMRTKSDAKGESYLNVNLAPQSAVILKKTLNCFKV